MNTDESAVDPRTAHAVTRMLKRAAESGGGDALAELLPLVYDELRRMAGGQMGRERSGHTLQPTALVHEAYFRLAGQNCSFRNRAHFFGVASQAMRRILLDHARAGQAEKRGGDQQRVEFDEARDVPAGPAPGAPDLLSLDEALKHLEAVDRRQARIVEMKYFGGMNYREISEAMGISEATIKRDWTLARAWLKREMARS